MGVEQITVVDSVWYYWILFLFAAIIGSTASSLTNNNGKVIMCGWEGENPSGEGGNPRQYCMGIISDIIIGIAAALGILWTMTPQTFLQLIGIGAVAGYGGSSVLRALTNKLAAQISQQEADKSKKEAEKNKDEAEKNKDEAEDNEILYDVYDSEFKMVKKNIEDIKDYLVKNNKEVLEELCKKDLIN